MATSICCNYANIEQRGILSSCTLLLNDKNEIIIEPELDKIYEAKYTKFIEEVKTESQKDIVEEKTNIEFLSEKVSKSTFLKIINIVTNSDVNYFTLRINNYLFSLKTDDEDIEVYRIKFIYDDYEEYKLSLGAIKIIELVYILISKNKLFLIDDFDYSLHPIVSRKFLELFFKIKNKNQIITVGHESNNLDFNIVRRDEIWFSEKKEEGTVLFPLENFKTERFDKKISKAYLNGEYGAIPKEIEDEKPKVIILKNDYRKKKSS